MRHFQRNLKILFVSVVLLQFALYVCVVVHCAPKSDSETNNSTWLTLRLMNIRIAHGVRLEENWVTKQRAWLALQLLGAFEQTAHSCYY